MREEHTPFYFNEEFDQVLRQCDEARAEKKRAEYKEGKQMTCKVCCRNHNQDQPCPRRVASSYVGDAQMPLTDADKAWMKDHSIDILEMVEEELADRMGRIMEEV